MDIILALPMYGEEYKVGLIVPPRNKTSKYKQVLKPSMICPQGNAYMDGLRTCLYLDVLLRGVQRRLRLHT